MDPSQFTAFSPYTNSNPFAAPNNPFFGAADSRSAVVPTNNNHVFQAPPQPSPIPPHPSLTHPPYSDMICTAIAALNEPDGSSKQAISRYIESNYTGIPPSHGALLTHHLKTLKNSGILIMEKKSYKFAATPPLTSVAVAAASAGLEPPRSDFMRNTVNENQLLSDPVASSTPQKRGRGRPPKHKPDVQPIAVQTNEKPSWEQSELHVSRLEEIQPQPPIRRPPGRPRKDGASPTVLASSSSDVEIVKRSGKPPSGRAAGRERKPIVVPAPFSVFPYVANGGVRRRGRPKRVESSVAPPPPLPPNAESEGEELAIVATKRRGRPPKIGGVIRKHMKPTRGYYRTGRPVGRPRKNAASRGASGQQDTGNGEFKTKFELFQEKAKEIVNVLKAEIGGSENQLVVQAIQALEELTVTTMETQPHHMQEMQPDKEHCETEPEREGQAQTEAEAMQESLF